MQLPAVFVEKVHRIFGNSGRKWLPELSNIVGLCREKWGLREGVMCSAMSMNYIEFSTTVSGAAVVLKVGVPHAELFTEMEALRLYGGKGAVCFLDADRELGAILMQRVQPGTMLWQLGDNGQETRIAASVMRELSVPVPSIHNLPSFSQWVERAFRLTRTVWDPQELMPRDLVDRAEQAFKEIERGKSKDVMLHGDLHHENILFDEQGGWIAIDPKGVIGAPCLEVGRFLQNRLPNHLPLEYRKRMIDDRLEILSVELGYSREILAAGGLVDCVLSHCWGFEDEDIGADWHQGIEVAWILGQMCGS